MRKRNCNPSQQPDGAAAMTGLVRSSADLDDRRKRLIFRAWRRGTREMDLVVGRFVEASIDRMDDAELDEIERLMEVPCLELYAWVSGASPVPANYDGAVFGRLCRFHGEGGPLSPA